MSEEPKRFDDVMELCSASQAPRVQVNLGDRSYEILIVTHELDHLHETLDGWMVKRGSPRQTRKALVITDEHIAQSHAAMVMHSLNEAGWICRLAQIPAGENSKSLDVISGLYDHLVDFQADRHTFVIAVGGGVVGDAGGFAAATYNRGLPFVQVPTTLLSQVDSSVGGKVGINHARGKNLIGAFHQPVGVMIDTSVLNTLPDRDYRSGLAEVVKYGVILDVEFFEQLEQNIEKINRRDPSILRQIVARSCRLKADVVEQDEFERTGLRAILNYGHTFAHAYEALCGYGELTHGEAVAIGMHHAAILAFRIGMISAELIERQKKLLEALHLPTALPSHLKLQVDDVLERMKLDKKTVGGKLRFILPTRLGHVKTVSEVPESEVLQVLKQVLLG